MDSGKSGSAAAAVAGAAAGTRSAAASTRGARMERRMRQGCQIAPHRRHLTNGPCVRGTRGPCGIEGLDSGTFQCHNLPMPDDPYGLADLARLADVTPRTIRYYVAQGLLPSPEAAGPATRYTEGHLLRLRLIRRLQRDHLPLAEIRARLEQMGDEAIAAAL